MEYYHPRTWKDHVLILKLVGLKPEKERSKGLLVFHFLKVLCQFTGLSDNRDVFIVQEAKIVVDGKN